MQILFAGPFLFAAALTFLVCASIPSWRKFAISLPVGILAFGAGALISFIAFASLMYRFHQTGPANWYYLIPALVGGLLFAILAGSITYGLISHLHWLTLKIGAAFSALCSSFAVATLMLIILHLHPKLVSSRWYIWLLAFWYTVMCVPITMLAAQNSESFRPLPRPSTSQPSPIN